MCAFPAPILGRGLTAPPPLALQVDRPSHHGLTSFQKLHREDAKRKFKRGLLKLKAITKLSVLHAAFKVTKANLMGFGDRVPRTQEEKKGAPPPPRCPRHSLPCPAHTLPCHAMPCHGAPCPTLPLPCPAHTLPCHALPSVCLPPPPRD